MNETTWPWFRKILEQVMFGAVMFAFGLIFALWHFEPMEPSKVQIDAGFRMQCDHCAVYNVSGSLPNPEEEKP